jgi:hypothetical protein
MICTNIVRKYVLKFAYYCTYVVVKLVGFATQSFENQNLRSKLNVMKCYTERSERFIKALLHSYTQLTLLAI